MGDSSMPFSGLVDPEQLKLLTSVLDEYCAANNISDERERRGAGMLIISLFKSGIRNPDALREAINMTGESDGSDLKAARA